MHKIIQTPNAPQAIGPYSQAIQAGPMTFISGQIPMDPETGTLETGDIEAQTRLVMDNLLAVVAAAGHRIEEIVKTTIFLKDLNDFNAMNAIYAEKLAGHRPARAAVEVARLPRDVAIEIEAICVKSDT